MIDLRIGNPDIIIEKLGDGVPSFSVETHIMDGMPYNKEGPLSVVVEQIKRLHEIYHPGLLTPNSQIVVGNGASQLVSAFFHLNKRAYVQTPCWFRTPILAIKQKSEMIDYSLSTNGVNLITYPNNPDGALVLSTEKTWYDTVYLWPWYFDSEKEYAKAVKDLTSVKKTTTIFTLSKMTGHCGTRFGWAIVEDAEVAKSLNEYMEYESGGLGFDTQIKAKTVIETLLEEESWQLQLKAVQSILAERKQSIQKLCEKHEWIYEPTAGMFAWISLSKNKWIQHSAVDIFKDLGILGTCGTKCGGRINQIRLNLAVNEETWNSLVELVQNEK